MSSPIRFSSQNRICFVHHTIVIIFQFVRLLDILRPYERGRQGITQELSYVFVQFIIIIVMIENLTLTKLKKK